MATPFEKIYDLALAKIKDYKLDSLYQQEDKSGFYLRMESYLVNAIPRFDKSRTSLSYTLNESNPESSQFDNTLSEKEQNLLAMFFVIEWFGKATNNLTQFELHLQDSNFKTFAEANNLKSKQDYLEFITEDTDRLLNTYLWDSIDIIQAMGAS